MTSARLPGRASRATPQENDLRARERLERIRRNLESLGALDAIDELDAHAEKDAAVAELVHNRRERRLAAALERASIAAPPTPQPRPRRGQAAPRGRQDGYQRRLERDGRRERRWRARQQARLRAGGWAAPDQRRGFERESWTRVAALLADDSGYGARLELRRLRRMAPAFAGAVARAALGSSSGACVRDWTALRARSIVAIASTMWRQSEHTRRRGQFGRLFRGIPIASLCALLANPWTGARPHRNTLAGLHSGASVDVGLGYLRALQAAGAFYAQQLPPAEVESWEVWTVRRQNGAQEFASNRYWLLTGSANNGHLNEQVRARLRELEAAAAEPFIACAQVPRAPRTASVAARAAALEHPKPPP